MNNDYPCICHHEKEAHSVNLDFCQICLSEAVANLTIRQLKERASWVHIFEPDNLAYLEAKYKNKNFE